MIDSTFLEVRIEGMRPIYLPCESGEFYIQITLNGWISRTPLYTLFFRFTPISV